MTAEEHEKTLQQQQIEEVATVSDEKDDSDDNSDMYLSSDKKYSQAERWENMFKRLCAFKKKHGHCLVPTHCEADPKLGFWVAEQRQKFKVGAARLSPITLQRKLRLTKIGFVWTVAKYMRCTWQNRFEQLLEFVLENGHTHVPIGWEKNKQLARWVSEQRRGFKTILKGRGKGKKESNQNKLTQERVDLLNSVGFVWESQRGGLPRQKTGSQVPMPKMLIGKMPPREVLQQRAQDLLDKYRRNKGSTEVKSMTKEEQIEKEDGQQKQDVPKQIKSKIIRNPHEEEIVNKSVDLPLESEKIEPTRSSSPLNNNFNWMRYHPVDNEGIESTFDDDDDDDDDEVVVEVDEEDKTLHRHASLPESETRGSSVTPSPVARYAYDSSDDSQSLNSIGKDDEEQHSNTASNFLARKLDTEIMSDIPSNIPSKLAGGNLLSRMGQDLLDFRYQQQQSDPFSSWQPIKQGEVCYQPVPVPMYVPFSSPDTMSMQTFGYSQRGHNNSMDLSNAMGLSTPGLSTPRQRLPFAMHPGMTLMEDQLSMHHS